MDIARNAPLILSVDRCLIENRRCTDLLLQKKISMWPARRLVAPRVYVLVRMCCRATSERLRDWVELGVVPYRKKIVSFGVNV
jgi:hypothetical protein